MAVKMKQLMKRKVERTPKRIGQAHLVVEIIEVGLEVRVVSVARIEEGVAFEVAEEAPGVAEGASAVAEAASVVAEGVSGMVMVEMVSEVEGEEVSGVEVVVEVIGENLERVLMVKVAGEISRVVKRMEDSRRKTLSSRENNKIKCQD
jgi:hypothetical protein